MKGTKFNHLQTILPCLAWIAAMLFFACISQKKGVQSLYAIRMIEITLRAGRKESHPIDSELKTLFDQSGCKLTSGISGLDFHL